MTPGRAGSKIYSVIRMLDSTEACREPTLPPKIRVRANADGQCPELRPKKQGGLSSKHRRPFTTQEICEICYFFPSPGATASLASTGSAGILGTFRHIGAIISALAVSMCDGVNTRPTFGDRTIAVCLPMHGRQITAASQVASSTLSSVLPKQARLTLQPSHILLGLT